MALTFIINVMAPINLKYMILYTLLLVYFINLSNVFMELENKLNSAGMYLLKIAFFLAF